MLGHQLLTWLGPTCQLKLVLVNTPSEAAVKLFHPTTEGALRERRTAWKAMHGALAKDGIWIYPKDLRPQCHNLDRRGQPKGGQVLNISEKKVAIPGLTGITCGLDNEGKSGCPGHACPSGPPGKCKFPFPAFNSRFF